MGVVLMFLQTESLCHMLTPDPHWDDIRRWDLWEVTRS